MWLLLLAATVHVDLDDATSPFGARDVAEQGPSSIRLSGHGPDPGEPAGALSLAEVFAEVQARFSPTDLQTPEDSDTEEFKTAVKNFDSALKNIAAEHFQYSPGQEREWHAKKFLEGDADDIKQFLLRAEKDVEDPAQIQLVWEAGTAVNAQLVLDGKEINTVLQGFLDKLMPIMYKASKVQQLTQTMSSDQLNTFQEKLDELFFDYYPGQSGAVTWRDFSEEFVGLEGAQRQLKRAMGLLKKYKDALSYKECIKILATSASEMQSILADDKFSEFARALDTAASKP